MHTLKLAGQVCEVCGSRAARFLIEIEGHKTDFFICLRKSCHWHGISEADRSRLILEAEGFHHPDGDRELIRAAPSFIADVLIAMTSWRRTTSWWWRSRTRQDAWVRSRSAPIWNVFKTRCSLEMQPREELGDMACPHCKKSLLVPDARCELCGAKAARFHVRTSRGDVSFFICARRQCHWHGLDDEARRQVELSRAAAAGALRREARLLPEPSVFQVPRWATKSTGLPTKTAGLLAKSPCWPTKIVWGRPRRVR